MPPTLNVNKGLWPVLGRLGGEVMGAAQATNAHITSNIVRGGLIAGSAGVGLWGAADPGGMGGVRGVIGSAGLSGAAFLGAGAWANRTGFQEKMMGRGFMNPGPLTRTEQFANSYNKAWGESVSGTHAFWSGMKAVHEKAWK